MELGMSTKSPVNTACMDIKQLIKEDLDSLESFDAVVGTNQDIRAGLYRSN
jgi:hypothetical protein